MKERGSAEHSASPVRTYGNAARIIAPLLEHGRECTFFIYFDMQVGFLNAAARRDVRNNGGNPSRFPGARIWDLLGHSSDVPARLVVESCARTREPVSFSTRARVTDASWVETDVIPVPDGILITYRAAPPPFEVSKAAEEAKPVQAAERQSYSEFQVAPDELPLAVIALDELGVVQEWNRGAEQMLQWTATEAVGYPFPAARGESARRIRMMASQHPGEDATAEEIRLVRKDGERIDARVTASVMRDSDIHSRTLLVIADESERQRTEAMRRATERMDAVRLLAGGVAHEFNNLLTAIKGFTVLVRSSVAGDASAMQHVSEIDNAADRAAVLTSQLLAFGRGQMLRPEALDVNGRLRQIERMLRLMLRENGELLMNLDANVGPALVDSAQFEEVVLNLVVSARDAIKGRESGRVTITTCNADLAGEFARWGVHGEVGPYVRLDVSHNGAGMGLDTQSHIFEPFYSTRDDGLHGLGLATVFGIIKQSNGYIWVDSDGEEGACFSVYLPRAASELVVSSNDTIPQKVHSGAPNVRILLVEDEDAVRRIARRSLEMRGYEIIEASDGAAALRLAEEHDIDLLVTDVMMPVMLGTTLVERLRVTMPDLPVLFMSGHSDALVRDGVILPSTPFLQKPFTPAQLTQKVRETLGHRATSGPVLALG